MAKTVLDVFKTFTDTQKNRLYEIIGRLVEGYAFPTPSADEFYPPLNEEQLFVATLLCEQAMEEAE